MDHARAGDTLSAEQYERLTEDGRYRSELLPAEVPVSWWPFARDLAIEIDSPAKTLAELHEKIFEYFESGTRQVWLVEPRTRTVTVYRSLSEIAMVREPDVIDGGDPLPGLLLKLDSFLPAYR